MHILKQEIDPRVGNPQPLPPSPLLRPLPRPLPPIPVHTPLLLLHILLHVVILVLVLWRGGHGRHQPRVLEEALHLLIVVARVVAPAMERLK